MLFNKILKRTSIALLLLAGTTCLNAFTPAEDGLYAVFETNKGEFAARLEMEKVPNIVANFVGLAEGTKNWLDFETGQLRKAPYYDGIIFHRVIADFMIQGGSPNGSGTDSPGYVVPDNIRQDLFHSAAGTLSMANSGANTNGSQFFITLKATSWLDGAHSVFGEIVEGLEIVQAIGIVPTDANNKPLDPVIMEKVTIVRQGEAAQLFETDSNLPRVETGKVDVENSDSVIFLKSIPPAFGYTYLFESENLETWEWIAWSPSNADDSPNALEYVLTTQPSEPIQKFYRSFPSHLAETIDQDGSTYSFTVNGLGTIVLNFADEYAMGTYTRNDEAAKAISDYKWYPLNAGNVQLYLKLEGLVPLQLFFNLSGSNSGDLNLSVRSSTFFTDTGTFIYTPAP